jgi:glycosyltransferase involved in cell wall biosynthesis
MFKLFQLEATSNQIKKNSSTQIDACSATLNTSGDIIYGPYLSLSKGHYMLSIAIDADNSIDSYLDITSNHAQVKYKKVLLKDLKGNNFKVEFDLPEITHDVEFRFHCFDNGKNIRLKNYSLYSDEPQLFGGTTISRLENIISEYGEYEYRSATSDPQLYVNTPQKIDGFLIVKVLIHSEEEIGVCDVFSIKEGRYHERISIPYYSGKEITLYIKSEGIEELRIDPLEKENVKFSFSATVGFINNITSEDFKEAIKDISTFYNPKIIEDEIEYTTYKKILIASSLYVKQNISYLLWQKNTEVKWVNQKEECGTPLDTDIKFSIVMPVYNSNIAWLQEAIDSVLSQTYINFELILVNDGSTNPNVIEFLHGYILKDDRLILLNRNSNGGISAATLNGISSATGSYVCFMDHDDLLNRYALSSYADLIHKNPNVNMLYSDEDLVDENGNRSSPHFKPDFNLDLLLSHNYITHFVCVRKELIEDWEPIKEVDGAQDYDLILHVVSKIESETITHVSNILYHWRAHNLSTAKNSGVKHYTIHAGKTAIERYLKKNSILATVDYTSRHHFYRVKYNITNPYHASKITIIIPTKDNLKLLRTCIESIISLTDYDNYDIIVVDNQTTEREAKTYLGFLSKLSNVTVIPYWLPFNWAAINNYAAKQSTSEYLLFLNNDIEIIDGTWLTEMVSQLERPKVGIVGAKLVYPDYSIQHAGVILGLGGLAAHQFAGYTEHHPGYNNRINLTQQLSAVTGACLGVKRSVFNEMGGFNEQLAVAYNDIEFCVRVDKAGHKIIYDPFIKMIHYESKTRGYDVGYEKARRLGQEAALFVSLHPDSALYDRFYNVNLSNDNSRFEIKTN